MDKTALLELKEEIVEAKEKVTGLKGQKEALLKQLKDKWKCDSVEKAKTKLSNLNKKIVKIKTQIDEGLEKLGEDYELN